MLDSIFSCYHEAKEKYNIPSAVIRRQEARPEGINSSNG